MKWFAVVVYVEADDAIGAVEAAGDRFANPEAIREDAALCRDLKVRPATRREREA